MSKFDALLKSLGMKITENKPTNPNHNYNNSDDWRSEALERQRKRKEEHL